jgi:PAS domain S-box-containing protein
MDAPEKQPTVLIVEDERIVALDIKSRLTQLGYDVVGVESSGEDAIAAVAARRPDIVLMDIKLRGAVDGIDVSQQLRQTSDVPVIFLTAYADEVTTQRAAAVAPYGYILKPFDERQLKVVIDAALQRHGMVHRLRESEAWLDATLRCAGDAVLGVIAADTGGRVRFINAEAERLTGRYQAEAVGSPLREVLRILPGNAFEGTRPHHEILIPKHGRPLPVEVLSTLIRDEGGRLYGTVCVLRDISARVRARDTHRLIAAISALLASTLETMPQDPDGGTRSPVLGRAADLVVAVLDGFCVVDVLSDDGQSIWTVAASHADRDKQEILRSALTSRSIPSDAEPGLGRVVRAGRPEIHASIAGDVDLVRFLGIDAASSAFAFGVHSVLCVPLVAGGRIYGALTLGREAGRSAYDVFDHAVAEDIAGRIAGAIDASTQYHRAQRAVRLRDDVFAIVTHDLKSPLATILASAEIMLRSPGDAAPEGMSLRRYALSIHRAGKRMHRLINDLLDAAAIETGHLTLQHGYCAADDLVREAAELFRLEAAQKSITLSTPAPEPIPILCDFERILQVFSNIIGNALKFTPGGGSIAVTASPEEGRVRFAVSDTGQGIPPEHLPHVFEQYWRGPERHRESSGLGLYIARGIVESHGGRIWAESLPGAGSTFFFTLPAAPAQGPVA